jgi:lipopolysaccharide/colanic/teichoic acid biosynthesis glycosyltransferase
MCAFTAVVVIGLGKAHAVVNTYDYTGSSRFAWSFAMVVVLCVAAYGSGLPDDVANWRDAIASGLRAVLATVIVISLVQLFGGDALLPRFVVFGSAPLLVVGYTALGALHTGRRSRLEARDRVLVIGDAADAEMLGRDLLLAPERPASFSGSLSTEEASAFGEGVARMSEVVQHTKANVLVLSRDAQNDDRIIHQAALLHESGVRIRTMSLFYEQWLGKLPVSELERVSLLFDISELHRRGYVRARRLVDLFLAIVAVVPVLLVTPVVAGGNLIANRGPLFYRQPRVGKGGVEFEILKFRTMTPTPQGLLNEWTTEDDPRITPFGRLLRRTHVDELPQILNILRGDLSFVGPRPEQPHYVLELLEKLPFYGLRHLVTPGLTGWAQVKYGYAGTETDALEKLQYEFFYLRHQSLTLDLRILMRTVRRVVRATGR